MYKITAISHKSIPMVSGPFAERNKHSQSCTICIIKIHFKLPGNKTNFKWHVGQHYDKQVIYAISFKIYNKNILQFEKN